MSATYHVNEIYRSVQGEGMRSGTANVFLRFTGCNMRCDVEPGPLSPGGFPCDTEFTSGRKHTLEELVAAVVEAAGPVRWVIATGGEPLLQLDGKLCDALHAAGFKIAVETNGTRLAPLTAKAAACEFKHWNDGVIDLERVLERFAVDWITLSPKVAEHCIKQPVAHELKYVRGYGQALPKTDVKALHYLISPSFDGPVLDQRTMDWCNSLVMEDPTWRLSLQLHKFTRTR